MDMKKTIGAIVAGFILQLGGSYLIHSVILMSSYAETSSRGARKMVFRTACG